MANIYDMNAAIQKPNILGAVQQGMQFGQQQRQLREERADKEQLRNLAPQIISGDPGAYDQAAAINPEAAGQYQKAGDSKLTRFKGMMDYINKARATAKQTGDMRYVNAALQQAAPYIANLTGKPPPAEWTPDMDAGWAQLEAQVAMAGQQEAQKNSVVSPGSAIVDPTTGRVVYERPHAPANAQLVEVPDGQGGKVQMMWDPKTRQLSEPQYPGQGGPAPTTGGGARVLEDATSASMLDPKADYQRLAQSFGAQITSLDRTPERNAQVGGVANSQHLSGTAADLVPPPAQKAALIQQARAMGYEAIDEGDHVHLELPPSGQVAQGGRLGYSPPKPANVPSGYRQLPDGSLAPIPGGPAQVAIDARADAAAARKAAEEVKAEQKRQVAAARQTEAAEAANQLVSAIDTLTSSGGFGDLGTAWGDVEINTPFIRNDAKDAQAQLKNIAGQVALATMAKLKALSSQGATGFGALSAPELKLLENSIAALQSENISNAQLKASLKTIRDKMDKAATWQPSQEMDFSRPAPGGTDAPQPGTVQDGYRFKGGNPADQNSWEPV